MKILALNAGSASLKFDLIEKGRKLFSGAIEGIGKEPVFSRMDGKRVASQEPVSAANYGEATRQALEKIPGKPEWIAHRVVHGGDCFDGPARVDESVIRQIEALEDLAPLHNEPAVEVIQAAEATGVPMIAVFDTVFHRTIPAAARTYAISRNIAERHGIHRFGFHGISHEWMRDEYARLTGAPVERANIITLHLESGCSACAIRGGKSVDTSMGFTPLEGLVMGMRSGDVDPALVGFLARKEKWSIGQVEDLLNKNSGLLGLSGVSHDTRELMKHMESNEQVRLAMEVFCYRARKYIGSYLAAMNGADAIVFGGGIGEDTPWVRERIAEGFDWCGLDFDRELNENSINQEVRLTRDGSRLHAWVVLAEESLMLAKAAERLASE